MNFETRLLNKLKAEQQEFAMNALKRPNERNAFEYGHRVGVMAGLESAIEIIINLLNEEKNG